MTLPISLQLEKMLLSPAGSGSYVLRAPPWCPVGTVPRWGRLRGAYVLYLHGPAPLSVVTINKITVFESQSQVRVWTGLLALTRSVLSQSCFVGPSLSLKLWFLRALGPLPFADS